MSRPVIYLDMDGVLNALGNAVFKESDWGDFKNYPNIKPDDIPFGQLGYDLALSKNMVSEIASLPVEVLWLTTWRHDAPKHVAPLVDAPEWEVLDYQAEKGAAIAQDQAYDPRPFIWIDDFEATEENLKFFLDEENEYIPFILIKPDGRTGLRKDHLNEIWEFLGWIESLSHTG